MGKLKNLIRRQKEFRTKCELGLQNVCQELEDCDIQYTLKNGEIRIPLKYDFLVIRAGDTRGSYRFGINLTDGKLYNLDGVLLVIAEYWSLNS